MAPDGWSMIGGVKSITRRKIALLYNDILKYRPEVNLLMVLSETPDKYILRWPEGEHELLRPLIELLGDNKFIGPNAVESGFHIAIIEFKSRYYWKVNRLVSESGVFISWKTLSSSL